MNQRGESWIAAVGGFGIFAAVWVVGYQVYLYLRQGEWLPLSVIDGLLYLFRKNPPPWLLYPEDWVGLHNVLDQIPLSLGLVVFAIFWCIVFGFLGMQLEEYKSRRQAQAEERSKRQDDSE